MRRASVSRRRKNYTARPNEALTAIAAQRGWKRGTHRDIKQASQRLAEEYNDPFLVGGFATAEKFHRNFLHGEMEDYEIEVDRPVVYEFVTRVLEDPGHAVAVVGKAMYEKIRDDMEATQWGRMVVIDVNTGDYEIADDDLTATLRLIERQPDAITWGELVGYPAPYYMRAPVPNQVVPERARHRDQRPG